MAIAINGSGTLTGVAVGGLPDGIVDTDMLAANAVTAAKATGSAKGITMVDGYYLSVGSATSSTDLLLSSNISKIDGNISTGTSIGSAMTNNSGTWSFPSIGKYLIYFQATFFDTTSQRYCHAALYTTADNSTYTLAARCYSAIYDDALNAYSTSSLWHLIDVTDTSNVKVQFKVATEGSAYIRGAADAMTSMYFIRLGDT